MVCIYCGSQLGVMNSRHQKRNNQVWRRRNCPECGAIFTTHEKIDLANSLAVKDSQEKLTAFNRDKLLFSILKSCGHRKDSLYDSAAIVDTIIARLSALAKNGSVSKREIIETSTKILQNFDKAAVVQYQAYHPLT